MGLVDDCSELFDTEDLYEVLKLERSATPAAIKKAYYKLSLKFHPDKASEANRAQSTARFQCLSKIHKLLSDEKTRDAYLEHGDVDTDGALEENAEWVDYWRNLYPKVTAQAIEKFREKYQNSPEEVEDLLAAYKKYKGDMNKIMESVPCSGVDDEERFRVTIKEAISNKKAKSYKLFVKSDNKENRSKRKRAAEGEATEAAEHAAELGLNLPSGVGDLAAMIKRRNKDRGESQLDALAAKYAQPEKKKTKRKKKV